MRMHSIDSIVEAYPAGTEPAHPPLPGDFILTHGPDWISRLIRFGQGIRYRGSDRQYAYWNHAALIVGPDELIEALGHGVSRTTLSAYGPKDYQRLQKAPCVSGGMNGPSPCAAGIMPGGAGALNRPLGAYLDNRIRMRFRPAIPGPGKTYWVSIRFKANQVSTHHRVVDQLAPGKLLVRPRARGASLRAAA
jgi:hypothetical protein